jgi:IS5 family transposase
MPDPKTMGRRGVALGPAVIKQIHDRIVELARRVDGRAKRFSREIGAGIKRCTAIVKQTILDGLRQTLDDMIPMVRQVVRQTRTRIVGDDKHAEGKLVSLFEPSTEVIRKGKAGKPTEFGKLVKLQEAENQIVIDYEVYARRPNDVDLLIPAIEAHRAKLGRAPRLVAGDAAFYSAKNEAAAKAMGSSACASPTAPPRAPNASASRKSAGSETAGDGGPGQKAVSASSPTT